MRCTYSMARCGPPPLARGEPRAPRRLRSGARTTPARAGRTRDSTGRGVSGADHPRSRGENRVPSSRTVMPRGPPPLARGEPQGTRRADRVDRTTPARAGRTRSRCWGPARSPDHPRSRGENCIRVSRAASNAGPPPLARGEHWLTTPTVAHLRTTPARAGRTRTCSRHSAQMADHPRSRGENASSAESTAKHIGPPPLARGEPVGVDVAHHHGRTTPARAGRTGRWTAHRPRRP